ncbi:hypothetical protein RFI_16810 [Reticulomyxa filosa]|uniref:t-SNARE coiled-coil homology domain-containing protein n=1 Tax=Reticulomyxa filosa TaxID=46433 RepID=X6N2Y1_RETFI|nr:hypothetical protein RFI_16810 [Reticulomyxa filosa]|eukprot:ETO20406.1 hypothetical protein RFI_16810 [Reticulomyxa filosa]
MHQEPKHLNLGKLGDYFATVTDRFGSHSKYSRLKHGHTHLTPENEETDNDDAQSLMDTDNDESDVLLEGNAGVEIHIDQSPKMNGTKPEKKKSVEQVVETRNDKIPPLLQNTQTVPIWLQIVKVIDINLREIQEQSNPNVFFEVGLLRKYHRDRLKITFDDDAYSEQDVKIEEITRSLTALFRDTDSKLKEIAYKQKTSLDMNVRNDNTSTLSYQERILRYNAMKSRAIRIQELTKIFRRDQRLFLEKLQSHESKGGKFIDNGVSQTLPSLDKIEQGFSKAQLQQLETIERSCNDRTREIIHIAKSVNELSQLFKELSVLIVEQGSILDRIDYNVEQTVMHLQAAHEHIKQADKYHKQSRSTLIVIVLMALIFVSLIRKENCKEKPTGEMDFLTASFINNHLRFLFEFSTQLKLCDDILKIQLLLGYYNQQMAMYIGCKNVYIKFNLLEPFALYF